MLKILSLKIRLLIVCGGSHGFLMEKQKVTFLMKTAT